MMNNLDESMDNFFILEEKFITADSIELSPEQEALAAKLSASAKPEERWQTYLDQLAMLGLEEWLNDRVPELAIKQDRQRLGYLTVSDFNLVIIRVNGEEDDVIVSKVTIDQPSLQPHLYVLVEVLAESGLVRVCGCLSQLQLMQQREVEAERIAEEDEATYLLPLNWFELDPAQVLLYLRCIHPSALVSKPSVNRVSVHTPIFSAFQSATSDISRRVKEEVKQAAQELSLIWQPSLQLSSVMRSQSEEDSIATIVSELQDKGLEIPPEYMYGYLKEDLVWHDDSLHFHVLKWNLTTTVSTPKWSLLLILGASHEKTLPPKLKLKIEDTEQNLVYEDTVSESTQSPYLYSQVAGTRQEQFNVIVEMPNQLKFRVSSISCR